MASKGKAKGKRGLIVLVVGLILVIVGALWLAVIWPMLNQLPTSLDSTTNFEGNMTVSDPANPGAMVTFPIKEVLRNIGNGTKDGALLITDTYTTYNALTGEELTAYRLQETLAVNRKTLEIETDVDELHRSGYWSPPKGLGEGDTYDQWNAGAYRSLPSTYVGSETFRGMKVVVFYTDESDIPLGNDPYTQLPLLMDTTITVKIDSTTGVVVEQATSSSISLSMGGQKILVQNVSIVYTEDTIKDLIDTAKNAKTMLLLMGTVLPWVLIGVGIVLGGVGIVFLRRGKQT